MPINMAAMTISAPAMPYGFRREKKSIVRAVENPKPPTTRARYLATEDKLRAVAQDLRIDFDELDLVLWSMKTGEVLK